MTSLFRWLWATLIFFIVLTIAAVLIPPIIIILGVVYIEERIRLGPSSSRHPRPPRDLERERWAKYAD